MHDKTFIISAIFDLAFFTRILLPINFKFAHAVIFLGGTTVLELQNKINSTYILQ